MAVIALATLSAAGALMLRLLGARKGSEEMRKFHQA